MNREEFSNEFDTLINAQGISPNFGEHYNPSVIELSEYEKSVFLTQAQDEIILALYNGKNQYNDSFEKTEELRKYMSSLVRTFKTKEPLVDYLTEKNLQPLDLNSTFYKLPNDVWFITFEQAILDDLRLGLLNKRVVRVIPTRQDELSYTLNNPFKNSNEYKALRLDIDNNIVEIISKYDIGEYIVRYIKQPRPIILTELPPPLTIKGEHNITDCELHSSLHLMILKKAVELALNSFSGTLGYGRQQNKQDKQDNQ